MKKDVIDLLESNGIECKRKGKEYICLCPFHDDTKPSCHINPDLNLFHCFACGTGGHTNKLLKKFGISFKEQKLNGKTIKQKAVRFDDVEDWYYDLLDDDEVMEYLTKERGFEKDIIKHFLLGVQENDGKRWITIPFLYDNKVVAVKKRRFDLKDFRFVKTDKSYFFNHNAIVYDELFITEGEFDAMSMWQMGIENVVSLPNGVESLNEDLVEQIIHKKIILVFDNGKAGKSAVQKIALRFGYENVYQLKLPGDVKDVNEFMLKYDSKDFMKLLDDIVKVEPEFIWDAEKILQFDFDEESGYHIEKYSDVSKKCGGVRKGDLISVMGVPKSGKTTFVLNITHDMKKAFNTLFYCLEMKPHKLFEKLVALDKGVSLSESASMIKNRDVDAEDYKYIKFAYPIGMDADEIIKSIEKSIKIYKPDILVFDNLHLLSRVSEYEQLSKYTLEFKRMAEKFDIMVFLVVQPRKLQPGQRVVTKEDVRGTSTVASDSDIILSLNREMHQPDDKEFEEETGVYSDKIICAVESRFGIGGYSTLKLIDGYKIVEYEEEWE